MTRMVDELGRKVYEVLWFGHGGSKTDAPWVMQPKKVVTV